MRRSYPNDIFGGFMEKSTCRDRPPPKSLEHPGHCLRKFVLIHQLWRSLHSNHTLQLLPHSLQLLWVTSRCKDTETNARRRCIWTCTEHAARKVSCLIVGQPQVLLPLNDVFTKGWWYFFAAFDALTNYIQLGREQCQFFSEAFLQFFEVTWYESIDIWILFIDGIWWTK